MYAAKALVAAITAFIALLAAREVALDPYLEATLSAAIAALTVYTIPNKG